MAASTVPVDYIPGHGQPLVWVGYVPDIGWIALAQHDVVVVLLPGNRTIIQRPFGRESERRMGLRHPHPIPIIAYDRYLVVNHCGVLLWCDVIPDLTTWHAVPGSDRPEILVPHHPTNTLVALDRDGTAHCFPLLALTGKHRTMNGSWETHEPQGDVPDVSPDWAVQYSGSQVLCVASTPTLEVWSLSTTSWQWCHIETRGVAARLPNTTRRGVITVVGEAVFLATAVATSSAVSLHLLNVRRKAWYKADIDWQGTPYALRSDGERLHLLSLHPGLDYHRTPESPRMAEVDVPLQKVYVATTSLEYLPWATVTTLRTFLLGYIWSKGHWVPFDLLVIVVGFLPQSQWSTVGPPAKGSTVVTRDKKRCIVQ